MYPNNQANASDLYQNIATSALAFTMYTTTFGNGSFVIQPPMPGQMTDGFPSIPYLSLEALLYQQQASNPALSPVNVSGGSSSGQQVIGSNQTANDATNTPRYLMGTQNNK